MKQLLVIADKPGGKNPALKRAANLQQHSKAKITLMGFCYADIKNLTDTVIAKPSLNQLEITLVDDRKKQLQELAESLNIKPSAITIKALWGKNISQAIIAYCKNNPIDMVIKSANRSETMIYTPSDWLLLRECPAPVMITARKSWKKKPCIVAALDFGTKVASKRKLNHAIYQQAQSLATTLDQEVHVVFALTVPQPLVDMDIIDPRKYAREKRLKLQPTIDKFCAEYGIDSRQLHIRRGPPEKVVPSIANKLKADVVVCGTVGRKGVKGKLIGNTVEEVLNYLYTDIVAVKP